MPSGTPSSSLNIALTSMVRVRQASTLSRYRLVYLRSAPGGVGERVLNAVLDVRTQNSLRRLGVAPERALKQCLVLNRRLAAPILERDHLIAEVFIEHRRVGFQQHTRAAIRDQGLVEFAVVALPLLQLADTLFHQPLCRSELVMRRDDAALPLDVGILEGGLHCMRFKKHPEFSKLPQVLG